MGIEIEFDNLTDSVRYRLTYGGHDLSFSAPMAETEEELGNILIEVGGGLKAPKRLIIAECTSCFRMITEDEVFIERENQKLCLECAYKRGLK